MIQASDVAFLYNAISGQLDSQNIKSGSLTGTVLANNSVSITQIKNTSVSIGVSPSTGNHSNGFYFNLPSGAYGFFPGISTDGNAGTTASFGGWRTADNVAVFDVAMPTGVSYAVGTVVVNAVLWLAVLNPAVTGPTSIGVCTAFYIQSSPPYDLGDGEIPLFVYALIHDATGDVVASYVSHDPPWARPHEPKVKLPVSLNEALADPAKLELLLSTLDEHHAHLTNLDEMQKRLNNVADPTLNAAMRQQMENVASLVLDRSAPTMAQKNEHMASISHPWIVNDLLGHTPVLLDPMSKTTRQLAVLHRAGENVTKLLHGKHLMIDNAAVRGRKGPAAGLLVAGYRFKNSKG